MEDETPNSPSAASAFDPTGTPEAMCSSTTRTSSRSRRGVRVVSGSSSIAGEAGDDVVDEQPSPPLEDDSTVGLRDDPVRHQQRQRVVVDGPVDARALDALRE